MPGPYSCCLKLKIFYLNPSISRRLGTPNFYGGYNPCHYNSLSHLLPDNLKHSHRPFRASPIPISISISVRSSPNFHLYLYNSCHWHTEPLILDPQTQRLQFPATAMDPSPASSSTASHSINSGYDVFINHRGPDTKNTFASYLYYRLLLHGFRPFFDKQELEEGLDFPSQIVDAIQNASVHVAIFSPAYADSRWCLHELVLMQETTATIVPVFYNVEPAELRWIDENKTGRYAEGLNKLQRKKMVDSQNPRYDSATIQKWRNALSTVADTSGFDLKAKFNGDEGLMLEKVIERVMKIMAEKTRLHVAKYPTGLDDKVKEFETTVLRQQHTGKAQVVGIAGSGGVGKTTMAKEFFNRKSSEHSKAYFLSDVRENAKISLHSLQIKLLRGLSRLERHIDDSHQGTEMLRKFFSSAEVLLVLDDIDHQDQIDALLPDRDALHKDSLILITSRDKDVLARSGVKEPSIYKLTGLTTQHSRELFCSYAFWHPYPLSGFEDLVNKFVMACDRLPLSLKVFGALLFGKDKYYWEDRLNRLHQVQLPSDIQNRLKISYDALSGDEKQIFLDIACFLIREKRNTAMGVWSESLFQNLESKCMVEVDSDGYIHMHDHLRDLGRQIGEEELPLRLWRRPENIDDWLHNLSSLQLLSTEGYLLERILKRVQSPNLIWLSWRDCPYAYLPSWIPTRNLRVLKVQGRELKTLWQGKSEAPNSFGYLNNIFSAPNSFGNLTNLYHMDLSGCGELERLPDSLGDLTNLHHMDLGRCSKLEKLPDSLGDLRNLHHMDLSRCGKLEKLPDSLGGLTNLHHMDLSWCGKLGRLPDSLGGLINLHHMDLRRCEKLERLPDNLGGLMNLHYMDGSWCGKLERLPDSLGCLMNLQHMDLHQCRKLESLPDSVGGLTNLHHMDLSWCGKLEKLPNSLGGLTNLYHMDLRRCVKLERLPDSLDGLTNLHRMDVSWCRKLKRLPDSLGGLTHLHHMDLSRCREIKWLPNSFGGLTNLHHMDLSGCWKLENLPDSLDSLTNLHHMDLSGCVKLGRLPDSLGQLTKLHHMDLSGCGQLRRLPDSVGSCNNLKYLDLSRCSNLTISSDTLGNITTLEHIDLSDCKKTEVLPLKLAHQRSLKILKLTGTNLKELPNAIEVMSNLEILWIGSPLLETLPRSLGDLRDLKELRLQDCRELQCLPASVGRLIQLEVAGCPAIKLPFKGQTEIVGTLKSEYSIHKYMPLLQYLLLEDTEVSEVSFDEGACPNLQHFILKACSNLMKVGTLPNTLNELELTNCYKMRNIEGLGALAKLQTLKIVECNEMQELPSLKTLVSLGQLRVENCVKLKSIRDLGHLKKLSSLYVSGCLELQELEGVENCISLRYLDTSRCKELQELSSIKTLVSLERLRAVHCVKLKSIRDLGHLSKLRVLDVRGCLELEEMEGIEYCKGLRYLYATKCPILQWGEGVVERLCQRLQCCWN